MAELNPPWALELLGTHHSNVNRMFMKALASRAEGVHAAADLLVAQRGAGANLSVDIAKGSCLVFGDENEFQGVYGCVNDATVNVAIAAADPTNPRWDLIVARVRDAFYSGGTNAWALERVAGTAAPSPADPVVPNNALVLARVVVGAGVASIVNANITDLRPQLPVGIIPGNSARPPGTLYGAFSQEPAFKPTPITGQFRYDQDTGILYVYDGAAWVPIGPFGAWSTFAPTLLQPTSIALATATGRYQRIGRKIALHIFLDPSGVGTAANDVVIGNIPAAIAPRVFSAGFTGTSDVDLGAFAYFDSGTNVYTGPCLFVSASTLKLYDNNAGGNVGTLPSIAVNSIDSITLDIVYEAAA